MAERDTDATSLDRGGKQNHADGPRIEKGLPRALSTPPPVLAPKLLFSASQERDEPKVRSTSQGGDKTRHTASERALKDSETRYRRLFETAQDGILILDAGTGSITD